MPKGKKPKVPERIKKRFRSLFPSHSRSSSSSSRAVPVSPSPGTQDDAQSAPDTSSLPPTATPSPNIPASRALEFDVDQDREHNPQAQLTPEARAEVLEPQGVDWRSAALENLNIAGRFAQTILKKLPDCVDSNPVKVALSVVKTIIDIKNEINDNKDELANGLKNTKALLELVEKTAGICKLDSIKQEIEIFQKEVQAEKDKLEELTKHLKPIIQILDYEKYKEDIQGVLRNINQITEQFKMHVQRSILDIALQTHDAVRRVALERLRPSEKADHRTVLEEQGLKREQCTPGTRVKILDQITDWANDPSPDSPRVFWLTGQAGSGKTTIAYTIAKRFEPQAGNVNTTVLGANFLCSRQFQETHLQTRILPTIAYQLARKCSSYAYTLDRADNYNAANYSIPEQMEDLFVEPWQFSADIHRPPADPGKLLEEVRLPPELPPYLIVIDALDEIKDGGGLELLRQLLMAISNDQLKGIKFFVTSRSNPEIVTLCQSFPSDAVCRLQDVPVDEVEQDIKRYLEDKLSKLRGSQVLVELERRAAGLFIYAATAVRYLSRRSSITPSEQTKMLQGLLSKSYDQVSASKATYLIDELYQQILQDAFSDLEGNYLTSRLQILFTFLCTAERTSTAVTASLLHETDEITVEAVLNDLHAVLYVQDGKIFWYHASFPDFIFDPNRSDFTLASESYNFSCNEQAHHSFLAHLCFDIMRSRSKGLDFNIGGILSLFQFDSDHSLELRERIDQNITLALRYSSSHWSYHLSLSRKFDTKSFCNSITDFLQLRILFWIEAMNLLRLGEKCASILLRASEWVEEQGQEDLMYNLNEAAEFATYFSESPASKSTPHLYISALPKWKPETHLAQTWNAHFQTLYPPDDSQVNLISTPGSPHYSVGVSGDGKLVASSSSYLHVRIWDAITGAEQKPLEGHTDEVLSIAFCNDPHGTLIVSGSRDKSVRVWDAAKGTPLSVHLGHTEAVYTVSFSNSNTQIVSGSHDNSVRIWNRLSGSSGSEIVLEGHTDIVLSAKFSPDDSCVVSGSGDKSIRVWDMRDVGKCRLLRGHTGEVNSVSISHDGTRIASGSDDQTIRVWDTLTGETLRVLMGHTSLVSSVSFSSDADSLRIVSGSWDESVRVWDTTTGNQLLQLDGHTDSVRSVAFSRDGTKIVSGSADGSVRLFNLDRFLPSTSCFFSLSPQGK